MNQHLFQRRGAWTRRLCASGAVIALLAGCAETQLGAQVAKSVVRSNAGDGQKPAPEPVDVAADPALAPEAFDATGLTIWDGGATLQGTARRIK